MRTVDDVTDMRSSQKSVVSVLLGIARGKGLLTLEDSLTQHIGPWSKATPEQEEAITLRHALSMSAGLDNDDAFVAPPGERWHYSLGIMTHCLKSVLEAVTGQDINALSREWLWTPLGLDHHEAIFLPALNDQAVNPRPIPRHEVMIPTAPGKPNKLNLTLYMNSRACAFFGELIRLGGEWDGAQLIPADYLEEATRPSQQLNPAYGLYFWLADTQGAGPGRWAETQAPADLVAAMGTASNNIYVSKELELVVVRQGLAPDGAEGEEEGFEEGLWKRIVDAMGGHAPPPSL